LGPRASGRRRSRRIPARWRPGLGKGGGGGPRGSPRSRFDGLEGSWEGPAGQFGSARHRPPRRREKLRRAGRFRAMRGRGGVLGVPRRCGGSWTATDGQGGRAHRAALMAAGGGVKQRVGRGWRVEEGAAGGLSLWSTCVRARLPHVPPP
jgi:hypothetical protein